ncbi:MULTISPECIES: HlyD family secretion protein [Prevotellaceae]|uniref:Hemolysin secretion protein D n=1 Tax=Hoylesella buccalis DNF00853 TaxID=1401074 RepID=A0A096BM96_9BACT|nr:MULTISPECIES: biotin/lipoyl-binding protein [Prevotellaceae]ERT61460.1 HlyD family secretion protein [Prevotella sp. BV3P1]KGF34269.1 hemolysin secretion protein D [Hoylesella buccalis DNF00853]KGF39932.1 hemolysin secretion protein D [Hoylesella buccalis DNF00985]
MSAKSQHNNILLAIIGFATVVILVAIIGFFTLGKTPEIVQGEIEVSEYRVSSKLPGRILELRVKEGDYVRVGDTLAILEAPEVNAQEKAAEAQQQAAAAMSDMADNGARKEQIQAAYQLWQQALAAADIAQKSYERVQNLFDQGVMSAQKRDEAFAGYKAREAQVKAAKSQYDMAKNGAREEEKRAAKKQAQAAAGAANVVRSLLRETVQVSNVEGEISSVYPKVGELVGTGSPIMSISIMKDIWGTFNIREDQLKGMKVGDTFKAYAPAFNKEINMKVFYIKDQGSYAVWKATKTNGQYDLKTFEVKARPIQKFEGLRPGMSIVIKES